MNTPQINDGGPAFPCESYGLKNGKETTVPAQGMSLRDYFAGQALVGMLASNSRSWCAEDSYVYADAMLKAREVKP